MSYEDLSSPAFTKKFTEELEKLSGVNQEKKSYRDDRIWEAQMDKSGNGHAVIRFLPPPDGEASPAAKLWYHAFQGPAGDWYYNNCLTTLGQKDPVTDSNNELWNTHIESNQQIARDRKRKLNYYSNIYVISDPANPENEGKVFIFKYGAKIYEHIKRKTHPDKSFGDDPVNIWSFKKGADFKLCIRKVGGWPNYDESSFSNPAPLFDGDDVKLKALYGTLYPIAEFVAPDKFKSYDELKKKFDEVIDPRGIAERTTAEEMEPEEDDIPIGGEDVITTKVASAGGETEGPPMDNAMEYFKTLAEEND